MYNKNLRKPFTKVHHADCCVKIRLDKEDKLDITEISDFDTEPPKSTIISQRRGSIIAYYKNIRANITVFIVYSTFQGPNKDTYNYNLPKLSHHTFTFPVPIGLAVGLMLTYDFSLMHLNICVIFYKVLINYDQRAKLEAKKKGTSEQSKALTLDTSESLSVPIYHFSAAFCDSLRDFPHKTSSGSLFESFGKMPCKMLTSISTELIFKAPLDDELADPATSFAYTVFDDPVSPKIVVQMPVALAALDFGFKTCEISCLAPKK